MSRSSWIKKKICSRLGHEALRFQTKTLVHVYDLFVDVQKPLVVASLCALLSKSTMPSVTGWRSELIISKSFVTFLSDFLFFLEQSGSLLPVRTIRRSVENNLLFQFMRNLCRCPRAKSVSKKRAWNGKSNVVGDKESEPCNIKAPQASIYF